MLYTVPLSNIWLISAEHPPIPAQWSVPMDATTPMVKLGPHPFAWV
jgi:hypothetical protein